MENPQKLVSLLFLVLLLALQKNSKKYELWHKTSLGSMLLQMMLHAPITQPVVTIENYVRNNHLYPCLKRDMSQVIDEISFSRCY
jgi:flagellar biosynthesis regulator FlbT